VWPNPSLNADVPHAGLRPRSGPPVSWYSLGPMLTRREVIAFCLAASTAPAVTCAVAGSMRLWWVTASVAYLAAPAIGIPLFAYLRHRGWPLASRSLVAAAIAGVFAALCIVTLVVLAFPPHDFLADPVPTLSLTGLAVAWGLGLGLIAGVALWLLLRRGPVLLSGA